MAITIERVGWMELFTQMRTPNRFLSRMFTIKPGNIYDGCKVAIDIERYGEDVAIAIKKCTGPNLNDFDEWTTKEFEPPSYGEAFPVDVCDLLTRMAGVDPHTSAYMGYAASLMAIVAKGFKLVDDKIARAVELQASQILQTGTLTLTNANGDTVYEVNFHPKATHFPTVGVSWSSAATATPLDDIQSLSDVIRGDGLIDSDLIIMGQQAWRNFKATDQVKQELDNRRIETGFINPRFVDSGATYQGRFFIGDYEYDIYTYPETYTDPQTLLPTKYVQTDKCIITSSRTRFDMTGARVPLPLGPDPRVAGLMPPRMSNRAEGYDVTPNLYSTPNGKQIMGELESRPLLIPVQIDGFGCLDTEI